MPGNPRLLASLLRQASGVAEVAPIPLYDIANAQEIAVEEAPLDGLLGVAVPAPEGPAVLLNSNQSSGRKRFTLAHELGHHALPGHLSRGGPPKADKELFVGRDALEREADRFAAELLMPRSLFGGALRDRDPDFQLVERLAASDKFFVSRTAAAIRVVELTREACVVCCCEGGRIKWWRKSDSCRSYFDRAIGSVCPPGSLASESDSTGLGSAQPVEVDPGTWFSDSLSDAVVLESTLVVPTVSQVVSLIWICDV